MRYTGKNLARTPEFLPGEKPGSVAVPARLDQGGREPKWDRSASEELVLPVLLLR